MFLLRYLEKCKFAVPLPLCLSLHATAWKNIHIINQHHHMQMSFPPITLRHTIFMTFVIILFIQNNISHDDNIIFYF